VTCLNTTGCAACAAGFGLAADGTTCLAAAAAPVAAIPTDLTTPVALALALPAAGLSTAQLAGATIRYTAFAWPGPHPPAPPSPPPAPAPPPAAPRSPCLVDYRYGTPGFEAQLYCVKDLLRDYNVAQSAAAACSDGCADAAAAVDLVSTTYYESEVGRCRLTPG